MDDNFISIALKNLPKGKTRLSESKNKSFPSDQWEINNDGTFKIETYKTIQQTETLSELEIDSMNPTVAEFIYLPKNKTVQPVPAVKRTTSQSTAPKKQRKE